MSQRLSLRIAPLLLCFAQAAAAAELETDVEVRSLRDGVWVHTSYNTLDDGTRFPSHGLIVREGDALTLIDTAWGEEKTRLLLRAIDVQIGLPVTRAVVTHFHGDRASGVDLLESGGIEVWAHPLTRQLATENDYPVPDLVFESLGLPGDVVELGALEVFYPGPAHTQDNLMVWLGDQGILFGGCAIRGAADEGLGNVRDGDIESWVEAMDRTEQRYGGASLVVPSHSEPGSAELIGHTAALARAARSGAGTD